MNSRIKQLAEQAGLLPLWVCVNESTGSQMIKPIDQEIIERFAELVRQDEREKCAKLLENKYTNGDNCECWLESMAEEIRGRTE